MLKKVRTAIVGCGNISNIYCKNLKNMFQIIDLAAVCDLNETAARTRAEEYGLRVMAMEELCRDEEIELVVNLTGPGAHYAVIKTLLEAGKNVYTEKPLCFDVEQGKELCRLAEEKGVYLGVAPDTILGAGVQTARRILDSGLIGAPTSCCVNINRNQPNNSELYPFLRQAGGSFPYDVGIYFAAAILSLIGPVRRVAGFTREAPVHDVRYLTRGNYGEQWKLIGSNLQAGALEFENGVIGTLLFDGLTVENQKPDLVIYGTEGIMTMGDVGNFDTEVYVQRVGGEKIRFPHTHGFSGSPLLGEPSVWDWGGNRGVGVAEMAWSMRKLRANRASKELGLHTLELLCGIDTAAKEGRVYTMTTTFERPAALPSGYVHFYGNDFDAEKSLEL